MLFHFPAFSLEKDIHETQTGQHISIPVHSTGGRLTYISIMIGAGERFACSNSSDSLQDGGLLNAVVWRSLQDIHQVCNKEVVLECRNPFLWQNGGLAAHRARKS